MPRVRVVLVRPETAANIGAVARALRNAGLEGLDLVSPGDWRTVECWRTAWGAQDVLEDARVFTELCGALEGVHLAAAFSGRPPHGTVTVDVREMAGAVGALPADESAALVFGPETAGLTHEEMALCGSRVLIPSHPAQPSLNLSHAVMVAAYEVFRAPRRSGEAPRRATHDEKERMLSLLRDGLRAIEALPAHETDRYFKDWRALFHRADLTPSEVRLLEHMARKMARRG